MGFLDDLIKGATDIFNETKNAIQNAQEAAKQSANEIHTTYDDRYDNPPEPLPAVPVQTVLNEHNVQFMISKDFIKDNEDQYFGYNLSFKYSVGEIDFKKNTYISLISNMLDLEFYDFYEFIEEYLKSKTVTDVDEFTDFSEGNFLFRVKYSTGNIDCDEDYTVCLYVLRNTSTDPNDYNALLLAYPDTIVNTNLEKKLISCFEETVKSFTFYISPSILSLLSDISLCLLCFLYSSFFIILNIFDLVSVS